MSARDEALEAISAFRKFHSVTEGKIALYGPLAFFLLWVAQAGLTITLEPRIKLPGPLKYETKGFIKIPCHSDKTYAYGFTVRVIQDGYGSFWSLTCRNVFGGWHWSFRDEPVKY